MRGAAALRPAPQRCFAGGCCVCYAGVLEAVRSSGGAPKDTSGTPREGPACSLGSSTGCEVPVEGGSLGGRQGEP